MFLKKVKVESPKEGEKMYNEVLLQERLPESMYGHGFQLWSVDLMGQLVHVTFHVHLRWRDRRLTFHNLQDNPSFNVIYMTHSRSRTPFGSFHSPVWHPKVQVRWRETGRKAYRSWARLLLTLRSQVT